MKDDAASSGYEGAVALIARSARVIGGAAAIIFI
jgi:hypothetical protein